MQHLILCRLFLKCFDPTVPRIGPGSYAAEIERSREMTHLLQRLCGIAMSQPGFGPCMILACVGVSICGDRFTDQRHREAAVDILARTQREHAYPTVAIQRGLLESWASE